MRDRTTAVTEALIREFGKESHLDLPRTLDRLNSIRALDRTRRVLDGEMMGTHSMYSLNPSMTHAFLEMARLNPRDIRVLRSHYILVADKEQQYAVVYCAADGSTDLNPCKVLLGAKVRDILVGFGGALKRIT